MRWAILESAIGPFSVASDDAGVCGARFGAIAGAVAEPDSKLLRWAVGELRAYFAGELTAFTVPLSVRGGTDFERAVWREMTTIPYGGTRTYGSVATAVGERGAARAVGVACNRNPIPVIVPCHRVVGAGGKLVGFGGGLDRKRRLLELEAGVALQHEWA
jgi:methylated-DNA-[protein]-cysteine S-methyltransferase